MDDDIDIKLGGIESITTDGDTIKRRSISVDDQIKAIEYKRKRKRKVRCGHIQLVLTRRI